MYMYIVFLHVHVLLHDIYNYNYILWIYSLYFIILQPPPSQDSLSSGDISTLDEASKHLVERDINSKRHSDDASVRNTPPSRTESADHLVIQRQPLSISSPNLSHTPPPGTTIPSLISSEEQNDSEEDRKPSLLS